MTNPTTPTDYHAAAIKSRAQTLIDAAEGLGYILTVEQRPRRPLAMGHYETVVEVRPARVLA